MSDTSSFQLINVGAVPNDGTGDDIRDAFIKINSNFSNIVAIGENVGNLKVAGFANIAGNINLSGYLNVVGNVNYSSSNVTTFQTFSVIGTTDSTTPTNGALVVAGGAGVVKNLHVGGTVTAAGFYGTISTTNQPSINQLGTLVSLDVGGSTTFHNVVYANTAMNSSNVYTGAMVIAGGIGLTGNLNLTGGIGAGGTLGQNGQFLVSSGMGIAWSNAPITSTLIYGATNVVASTNFANIGVNGTNIASFSNTSLTISGNISANYFTGNGALLTGISTYGNTNVAAYLTTVSVMPYGNTNVSAYLSTSGISSYGNANVAAYLVTNPPAGLYTNANVAAYLVANPQSSPYGNTNVAAYLSTSGISSYGNANVAAYLVANPQTSSYGNTSVAAYLPIYSGSIGGTLTTAAQSYITSLGVLSGLTISGTHTINSNSNATAIINGASNGVGNIGASGATFNTVFAKATTAQYADLAEKYLSDQNYECGTVVMVGGTQEVTASKFGFRAIGVVSTNPAYMMNSELEGGTYIALKGRVPVKVTGKVSKGDSLIGADNGLALSASGIIAPNMVFAIALEDNDNGWIDVIEAIIL